MSHSISKFALALVALAASGLTTAQTPTDSTSHARAQSLVDVTSHRTPQARIERNIADAASPPHGPVAAASAAAEATAEHNARAEAEADLAARQAGDRGKLKVDRETLTGLAAKQTLLRQGLGQPNYDHSISMGDKDHVEQVTDFRIYVQKPAPGQ